MVPLNELGHVLIQQYLSFFRDTHIVNFSRRAASPKSRSPKSRAHNFTGVLVYALTEVADVEE